MASPPSRAGKAETAAGCLVLLILLAIAAWLFRTKDHLNPAVTELAQAGAAGPPGGGASSPAEIPRADDRPADREAAAGDGSPLDARLAGAEGLSPLAAAEHFDAETLSDKINGKAELYLAAGFRRLACRRFALRDDREQWFEVFAYDMGSPRRAFAVFNTQRREGSEDIALEPFAYRTADAVFFVHGPYYIEMTASSDAPELVNGMLALAKQIVEGLRVESASLPELALLPREGQIAGSLILYPENGLGFDGFRDLFLAGYRVGGTEVSAFVVLADSEEAAAALAKRYVEYLLGNGGTEEQPPAAMQAAGVVNMFGTYELVFSSGRVVSGVHEAPNTESAERLAAALRRAVTGREP